MKPDALLRQLRSAELIARTGRVRRIMPTFVEADGPALPLGALCTIECSGAEAQPVLAEITRVDRESVTLAPFEDRPATFAGARVTALPGGASVPVGDAFLGRAVDSLSRPIDRRGRIDSHETGSLNGAVAAPLSRVTTSRALHTGVRAIDGLLTLGVGQRIGVFAASGVGKTSLLGQLTRQVDADRCVICLVGERGREVEALWSHGLPAAVKARTTMVAATSDQSAAMRARSAGVALALAEHWRARGHHVLLVLDSVTRLAMALREIGLAAGEPPTVRAYTPGVFAAIPRLVERCGALAEGGAITAIMTVLSETDEVDDPVSELMKSLLDGHILLSRTLAEQGHFPAIDVTRSVSRLATGLMAPAHRAAATDAAASLATYDSSRTLIESGIYTGGSDSRIDRAIALRPALLDYLRQAQEAAVAPEDAVRTLVALARGGA